RYYSISNAPLQLVRFKDNCDYLATRKTEVDKLLVSLKTIVYGESSIPFMTKAPALSPYPVRTADNDLEKRAKGWLIDVVTLKEQLKNLFETRGSYPKEQFVRDLEPYTGVVQQQALTNEAMKQELDVRVAQLDVRIKELQSIKLTDEQ